MLLGTAAGFIDTAAYSFAASNYPEDCDKVISIMEGVVGVGCVFGPVMGSFVYNYLGFATTFYIFGAAMAPSCIFVLCIGKKPKVEENVTRSAGSINSDYDEVKLEYDETGLAMLPDDPKIKGSKAN